MAVWMNFLLIAALPSLALDLFDPTTWLKDDSTGALTCSEITSSILEASQVELIVSLAIRQPECLPLESRFLIAQFLVIRFGSTHELVHGLWKFLLQPEMENNFFLWLTGVSKQLNGELVSFRQLFVDSVKMGETKMDDTDSSMGAFSFVEAARRQTFNLWVRDDGLVKGLMQLFVWESCSPRMVSVGDFGAGGGHYASVFNSTGLIEAFAFDGTAHISDLTDNRVQYVDLTEPGLMLFREFDWVISIEVAEHIPQSKLSIFLKNLAKHAKSGIVLSWATSAVGIGHVSHMPIVDSTKMMESETGFVLDEAASEKLQARAHISYIEETVRVFRKLTV